MKDDSGIFPNIRNIHSDITSITNAMDFDKWKFHSLFFWINEIYLFKLYRYPSVKFAFI